MFAHGLVDDPVSASAPIDFAANEAVSQADEEQGAVLLKNDGNLLPLGPGVRSIVVIGGHADKGVLAGSGSSLVYPRGGNAVPGIAPTAWPGPVMYYPSSPVDELRRLLPQAKITFVDGTDPAAAAAAARSADVAIVFGTQWSGEGFDVAMALDGNQNALIDAVAQANPRTAVVLETNAGVAMPWAARVPAILEAWYPGRAGGKAIANLLTGRVNPSGHLPVTFAASESQLPRPVRPGGKTEEDNFPLPYTEGAAVGYKWFDKNNLQPLFPFGHGLSYTRFELGQSDRAARTPTARSPSDFSIRNTGQRRGMEVAQVYASPANGGWEAPKRLAAFQKVDLTPGAARTVSVTIDPRLLATFDDASQQWRIAPGAYQILVGESVARHSRRPRRSLCRGSRFRRTGGRDRQPLPQLRSAASEVDKHQARARVRGSTGGGTLPAMPLPTRFVEGEIIAALARHLAARAVAEPDRAVDRIDAEPRRRAGPCRP